MANITGTNGNDTFNGTNDADNFYLFDGNDVAYGYENNDLAWGDAGNDWFSGDNGDDSFVAGYGADTFYGGLGGDTTFYHMQSNGVNISLINNNTWDGLAWDYQYDVEHAHGSGWNDTISGNAGNNGLIGVGGADYLAGLDGNDTLFGGDQSDTLVGGNGNDYIQSDMAYDTLEGGAGADLFGYNSDVDTYWDSIRDFNQLEGDKIGLNNIDASSTFAGDQAFTWVGNTNAPLSEGQLGYYQSGGNTYIYGFINTDNLSDVFMEVTGTINLTAFDFYL